MMTTTPITRGGMKRKIGLRWSVKSEHPFPNRRMLTAKFIQAQPVPQPATDGTTSTLTSTLTGDSNGSAGNAGVEDGMPVEHAGPRFSKVEPAPARIV